MLPKNSWHPGGAFVVLGAVAIATITRTFIDVFLHEEIPYSTFYPAVMFTALVCGFRWGMVSVGLSAIAASFWLSPFGRPLIMEPTDMTGMLLFLLVCTLIVWLAARVSAHRQDAERAAADRQSLLEREQIARQQAEEANRAKDDFLAAVSHELRTPLQSILGWVELLQMKRMNTQERQLALESIQRSAKIQTQLVDDLMELSRIQMGKLRIEPQSLPINEVVTAAIQTVMPAASAKNIVIESVPVGADVQVLADPERLHQVIWNLLSNAIKFTSQGGDVQVLLVDRQEQVELRVVDSGEGMEPDFVPCVFERFRQADGTERGSGLGLGLAIVRELVQLHGGTVAAASEGKGKGSEFRIVLPRLLKQKSVAPLAASRQPVALLPRSQSSVVPRPLAGRNVLIVDDDPNTRVLVSEVLLSAGASATAVGSAQEAEEFLAHQSTDVLISDLAMPEVDGFELMRRVRARLGGEGHALPAIALTAHIGQQDRRKAIDAGFQVHLGKPVEPRHLVDAVAALAPDRPSD